MQLSDVGLRRYPPEGRMCQYPYLGPERHVLCELCPVQTPATNSSHDDYPYSDQDDA